ncbi:hypothetical protein [Bacillus sp. RIT 809]|uniref:hypothetical protein n=1 Tax=Bacillus sp. RIT 809 TaxID=2803857 RepID=UPI00194FD482|nr:hypothetical protein [Bacillus sp. RIT 809]MBM6649014.1 hypothetical protein [Bacillus sp. RIT 809]
MDLISVHRVAELKGEIGQYEEEKETIQNFILEQQENIPKIVLDVLNKRIRMLRASIHANEARLKAHE